MRNKQLIAFSLGVALFGYLIYETGPASLTANLELIGPKLVFILALERIVDLFNTVGWWFTFAPNLRRGTLGTLYLVRLAGTAIVAAFSNIRSSLDPLPFELSAGAAPAVEALREF